MSGYVKIDMTTNERHETMKHLHGSGLPTAVRIPLVGVMAMAILLSACGGSSTQAEIEDGSAPTAAAPEATPAISRLTGDITIEGAFELSHIPSSRVVVRLEDVSMLDVPSVVLAEQVYSGVTTLPLQYELSWEGELDSEFMYAVSASIYEDDGELLFWTDTSFPVEPGDIKVDFFVVAAL